MRRVSVDWPEAVLHSEVQSTFNWNRRFVGLWERCSLPSRAVQIEQCPAPCLPQRRERADA